MKPYDIVLADDHVLFRQGIRRIIEESPELKVVGEAGDGLELLELLKKITPALVILDISMPHLRGLEASREIRKAHSHVKILLLTMHKTKELLRQGIAAGVDGFLVKEDADAELLQAIHTIRKGGKFFSPHLSAELAELVVRREETDPLSIREREVLKLLAEGKSNQEIADLLYISIYTVRRHRDNLMRKLKLKGLADLIRYALDQGYLTHML
uniref:Response regulator transcription factor n=1 Tax=Desulfobacca acetoxidans TaxID=60893 RepID=A0A7V4LCV5_9BACT